MSHCFEALDRALIKPDLEDYRFVYKQRYVRGAVFWGEEFTGPLSQNKAVAAIQEKERPYILMDHDPYTRMLKGLGLHVIPLTLTGFYSKAVAVQYYAEDGYHHVIESAALTDMATTIAPNALQNFRGMIDAGQMAAISDSLKNEFQMATGTIAEPTLTPGSRICLPWDGGREPFLIVGTTHLKNPLAPVCAIRMDAVMFSSDRCGNNSRVVGDADPIMLSAAFVRNEGGYEGQLPAEQTSLLLATLRKNYGIGKYRHFDF